MPQAEFPAEPVHGHRHLGQRQIPLALGSELSASLGMSSVTGVAGLRGFDSRSRTLHAMQPVFSALAQPDQDQQPS